MTVIITHSTTVAATNNPAKEVSKDAWNDDHNISGLAPVAESNDYNDLDNLPSLTDGVPSGTSFPGGPSTGDFFYRSDRSLLYFYDGTRWLTVQQYTIPMAVSDALMPRAATTTSALRGVALFTPTYDMWLESLQWAAYVGSPSSGTQYWNIALNKLVNATPTAIVTDTTNGDTNSQWQKHEKAIGALLGTTSEELEVDVTRVSTAGSIYIVAAVVGRMVG